MEHKGSGDEEGHGRRENQKGRGKGTKRRGKKRDSSENTFHLLRSKKERGVGAEKDSAMDLLV